MLTFKLKEKTDQYDDLMLVKQDQDKTLRTLPSLKAKLEDL